VFDKSQEYEHSPKAVRLPSASGIMFRRTTVSAEDAIERSREIYAPLGGKFNEAKLRWRMPNGGRVISPPIRMSGSVSRPAMVTIRITNLRQCRYLGSVS
jgi:hypothetical protein